MTVNVSQKVQRLKDMEEILGVQGSTYQGGGGGDLDTTSYDFAQGMPVNGVRIIYSNVVDLTVKDGVIVSVLEYSMQ
jgi:hypothetical protein